MTAISTTSNVGNCATDTNPDAWFPERSRGRSTTKWNRLVQTIDHALDLCKSCPIQEQCLEIGMQKKNLPYGIWGGTLPGDRMLSAGYKKEDFNHLTPEGQAWGMTDKYKEAKAV